MFTQGTIYVQEWKNGVAEYANFSDIHITCKYGWKSMDNGTTQVGALTDVSLAEQSSHDFITIMGDSCTIEASWDDEQHMMESPVLYDIVFTVNNQKINKMSWNPTNNGWTTISDCDTVEQGINNGYAVEILNNQKDIHVETQTDTKAWSTTEPYFGTGVIADGAYFSSLNNYYIIIDGTNHPGELSFSQDDSWDSDNVKNYSKQTSGSMFYMWDPANVTQCSSLNHYTWDPSDVRLCHDNTTELSVNGVTYTKQNPGPSYYELKCGFNYGGSVRPAKTFIRWGTNEPYSQITYGGVNPDYFSWQEQSVPSGEIGTLVIEFVDSNDNGLTVDSYSSQDYVFDTDTAGSYGGTRLLIKSPDNSNIYDYSAGNFIECDITLSAAPQPTETYTVSVNVEGPGTVSGAGSYTEFTTATLTATPNAGSKLVYWYDNDNDQAYYDNPWSFTVDRDWNIDAIFAEQPPTETYTVSVNVTGQGTTTGAGSYEEGDQVTLTAIPSTGYEFNSWQINGTVVETNSTYQFIMGNQDVTITAVFVEEAEKHIYLCDNSGAHLAEMTNTGSTWSVSGAFTSGQYSIRATVEGEYNDAWFKFYQTSGDNRIFVGAGDDPSFEDIGTYIMIDDILTSFSLTEDQTTGYYVVSYENTGAMTVSMVDTIVNSYIGDFVTGDEISAMGYMTQTDISSMGYMTATDISAMSYVDSTSLSNMSYITMADVSARSYVNIADLNAMSYVSQTALSAMGYVTAGEIPTPDLTNCVKYADLNVYAYVSQPALSAMSYVDNSYLSTYMNSVVGDINAILQTI